jgi:hypothetical protein
MEKVGRIIPKLWAKNLDLYTDPYQKMGYLSDQMLRVQFDWW